MRTSIRKSRTTTSNLLITNIHCPSCVEAITLLLSSPPLSLDPNTISISILTRIVTFLHPPSLLPHIKRALTEAGYEIAAEDETESTSGHNLRPHRPRPSRWFETQAQRQRKAEQEEEAERKRYEAHRASCLACRDSTPTSKGKAKECVVQLDSQVKDRRTTLVVGGMTCSSCVGAVGRILSADSDERIKSAEVTLLPGRAVVLHDAELSEGSLTEMLEDGGYAAEVVESVAVAAVGEGEGWVESKFVIEGMTCSSCVQSLNGILDSAATKGIRSASVTLLPGLATITHDPQVLSTDTLTEMIEDGGYGAELLSSLPLDPEEEQTGERKVKLRIDGMFCDKCSSAINVLLSSLQVDGTLLSFTPISMSNPTTTITYIPRPPSGFTLRTLRTKITALGPFTLVPLHLASTLSTLAAASQAHESRAVLTRFLITFLFAIPTFLIGIVFPSLLPSSHHLRRFFEDPVWGSASRGMVALFALSTPIQFGIGTFFYSRAWKSLRGVWRRGNWKDRLLRWGSMDTLVALGTTAGWAASVGFMAIEIRKPVMKDEMGMSMGNGEMGYFDSTIFLMLFILFGRWLEGISRKRTGDAVEALGKMKVEAGLLYTAPLVDSGSLSLDRKESFDTSPSSLAEDDATSTAPPSINNSTQPTELDFLEVGDHLLIPSGSSVPLDSTLVPTSSPSSFDESSLTGESIPVLKSPGDAIFAGSTNLGPSAVIARVTSHAGETMIDGIVQVVRDAMANKAGIERIADKITGIFVPVIVAIAATTFVTWIARGYAGGCPDEWLDKAGARDGGWAFFSVQFAVAVLVVACPCGIGLAAPTAQMVGTGIAARLGIVPYGGGEAFQNANAVNVVVFDKTGTITRGEFSVSNHHLASRSLLAAPVFFRLLELVEDTSAHPISLGLRSFCKQQATTSETITELRLVRAEEIPGRGLAAIVAIGAESTFEILVGNELLLQEMDTFDLTPDHTATLIAEWGAEGSSIVLVALRPLSTSAESSSYFTLAALFAVQDTPRPESAYVVSQLESQGIAVYLCTGDNKVTARAVAKKVGIQEACVQSGVMPVGKKEFIETLQRGGAEDRLIELRSKAGWWRRLTRRGGKGRAKVLFVGDGINDVVALTQADVGVSMGTGASVALSSSDFCILSSNLLTLLTVLALSRSTFNKILTNFVWAASFNTILVPIAAGAFYDLGGIKLPPVWASLAMALSSVSVVLNSLLLRWTFSIPKAVRKFKI